MDDKSNFTYTVLLYLLNCRHLCKNVY